MERNKTERVDDLHIQNYRIIQNKEGFCFGMDAVLLSDFAKVKEAETVLDMGTGTGIIPILLEAKTKGKAYMGLEIQEEFVDMARRSVQMTGQADKVTILHGDIKEAAQLFPLSTFDVITSNPPYMNSGKGLMNPSSAKAIARHEVLCSLEDVIYNASKLLRVGGRFYMVHRPQRLMEIFATLKKHRLEPKQIRMVHSYAHKEATMVLIEAIRGGNPLLKVHSPLIIYSDKNQYSSEIYKIYGKELPTNE